MGRVALKGGAKRHKHRSNRILVGCANTGVDAGGGGRMRRIRRKRKFTWLPILGTRQGDAGEERSTLFNFAVDIATDGSSTVGLIPITYDIGQEFLGNLNNPALNLNDILGEEYFIKRLVGKCFVQYSFLFASPHPPVYVTAGFFIGRHDNTNVDVPVNFSGEPQIYNPQDTLTVREPWIWRRAWMLGDQGTAPLGDLPGPLQSTAWPLSNSIYGSVLDGPHIDAKTARRVRAQERLFFAISAQNAPVQTASLGQVAVVNGYLDLRVLGQLRRTRNRGSF